MTDSENSRPALNRNNEWNTSFTSAMTNTVKSAKVDLAGVSSVMLLKGNCLHTAQGSG